MHEYLCTTCVQCLWVPEEGSRSPQVGVKVVVGTELGLLKEQPVLQNAEPSLQSPHVVFLKPGLAP